MDYTINNIYITCKTNNSLQFKQLLTQLDNNSDELVILPWYKQHKVSKKKVDMLITNTCNILCTNKMIQEWICHVTLYEHIYNKYDRVLILDEDIVIKDNFLEKLGNIWDVVPYDWDIIFLDKDYPLSGYIVSLSAINKIIKSNSFSQIRYDLRSTLDNFIKNNNMNAVYLTNKLVNLPNDEYGQDLEQYHQLMNPIVKPIFGNINNVIYRFGSISITYYLVLFAIAALIFGYLNNDTYSNLFVVIVIFQQLIELGYFNLVKNKVETLGFELMVIVLFYVLGHLSHMRSRSLV